jgi:predicted O-methyltransferase YrrM
LKESSEHDGRARPQPALAAAQTAAATVEGWLTPAEGELLFNLAATCPSGGTIVEIGSWKGKSTTWLGMGAGTDSGIRIYSIDPHEPYLTDPDADSLNDFRANMDRLGLAGIVTAVVRRSAAAAQSFTQPIDVLFIDGDHEEAAVAEDLAVWLPKVKAGGFAALHDVRNREWPGVSRSLSRALWASPTLADVRFVDSIVVMRCVARNTVRDRWRNSRWAVFLRAYHRLQAVPPPLASLARKLLFR